MEIRTTVRNFAEQAKLNHIPPDSHIRVILNESNVMLGGIAKDNKSLPMITPEEQRYFLNLIQCEYDPEASSELIGIIENSHKNTDTCII